MKAFTIGTNDAGQRLDRFLFRVMPGVSQGVVYSSLRKKKVRINGKRITDGSLRLAEGDRAELYISDEYFPEDAPLPFWASLTPKLSVVYEDVHILVMNKPSGLLSQGEDGQESLEAHMRAYLLKKGTFNPGQENGFLPSLCHRIDRNTAGLVIGAKDAESLRILNRKIRDKEIRKFYLCETEGTPKPERGQLSGWLIKTGAERKMRFSAVQTPGAVPCQTRYRVLKRGASALVEAELLTGRTHQLRAGFAHLGHPLIGDVKYGAGQDGKRDFQHLVAYRLVFDFRTDSGILSPLKGLEIVLKPEGLPDWGKEYAHGYCNF